MNAKDITFLEKTGDLLFANKKAVINSHKKSIGSELKSFIYKSETKHKWNEYLITKGVQKVMEEIKDISQLKKFLKKGGIETSHQHIKKFQRK